MFLGRDTQMIFQGSKYVWSWNVMFNTSFCVLRASTPLGLQKTLIIDLLYIFLGLLDQCKMFRSCWWWWLVTKSCPTLCDPMSFTISPCLLRFMSIESVMLSNHLILYHCLLLLPSIFPRIRVFSSELALHIRWPKYWSFSFSISPSNECSQLISIKIDQLDLLAVQGTLKSLLQHHS